MGHEAEGRFGTGSGCETQSLASLQIESGGCFFSTSNVHWRQGPDAQPDGQNEHCHEGQYRVDESRICPLFEVVAAQIEAFCFARLQVGIFRVHVAHRKKAQQLRMVTHMYHLDSNTATPLHPRKERNQQKTISRMEGDQTRARDPRP